MTPKQAEDQLKRVFTAFPSYRQVFNACEDKNATLDAWILMLESCDADDVKQVVDLIVLGDMEPTTQYQKGDMLPRNIKTAANEIRSKRNEKRRQEAMYHVNIEKLRSTDQRYKLTSREATRLGAMVRKKEISQEENDKRMTLLMRWDKGEDIDLYWISGSLPGQVEAVS